MSVLTNAQHPVNDDGSSNEASAATRLEDLETKRLRYEALGRKLFTLPQKLRHPGLIPIGPRLYLPGELTNTNRLTVLLGSCNDEAYFAERSASQAQGIVQRRLALIDDKVREVAIAERDVDNALEHRSKDNGRKEDAPDPRVDLVEGKVKKVRRRVSFREPVVTQVHVSESYKKKKKKGRKSGSQTNSRASGEHAKKPSQKASEEAKGEGENSTERKLKTAASVQPNNQTANDSTTVLSSGSATSKSSTATGEIGDKRDESADSESLRAVSSITAKVPKDEISLRAEQEAARSHLNEAIRNAERQVLEQGVVNITEVFEGDAEEASSVELPTGFTPDSNINFDDDSEEFLDMTGRDKAKSRERGWTDATSQKEYWDGVLAAEREAERENERVDKAERKRRIRTEEREFGTGFAKGFFGAPRVKQGKAKTVEGGGGRGEGKNANDMLDVSRRDGPSPNILFAQEETGRGFEALRISEGGEGTGVRERVVERRETRRGKKKTRGTKGRPSTVVIPDVYAIGDGVVAGGDIGHEAGGEGDGRVSKFKEVLERRREESLFRE